MSLLDRAFIVGPNASGKSYLLDAFDFLADLARPTLGGLQTAVGDRGDGFSSLHSYHAKKEPWIEIDVSVGNDANPSIWRYRILLKALGKAQVPTVAEEQVWKDGQVLVERRQTGPASDQFLFEQTWLEQSESSRLFRELADFLASCRLVNVVPHIFRGGARERVDGLDPFGGNVLPSIKSMSKAKREARLQAISKVLALAVPNLVDITYDDSEDGEPHLLASYHNLRGRRLSEATFSDGTVRLIGLLWSIADGTGPLLLEEPELSLNEAVVREIPGMFARMQRLSGPQVIATTHSGALLDDLGIGLREVHMISVDPNGSSIETIADNKMIAAQVDGGMTICEAVLPLLSPNRVHEFGRFDLVG